MGFKNISEQPHLQLDDHKEKIILKSEIGSLDQVKISLRDECEDLKREIHDLRQKKADLLTKAESQLAVLRESISQEKQTLHKLVLDREMTTKMLQHHQEDYASDLILHNKLKAEHEELLASHAESKTEAKDSLSKLIGQHNDLAQQVVSKRSEVYNLDLEISQKDKALVLMNAKIVDLEKRADVLTETVSRTRAANLELERVEASVKASAAELSKTNETLETYQSSRTKKIDDELEVYRKSKLQGLEDELKDVNDDTLIRNQNVRRLEDSYKVKNRELDLKLMGLRNIQT